MDSRVVIANLGYADGYLRCHAGSGSATWRSRPLPLIGRVSMDLTAFDASEVDELQEGNWLTLDYDLPSTSARSGLSQYELLTGLGPRFERRWI
jgi:alanine racemase